MKKTISILFSIIVLISCDKQKNTSSPTTLFSLVNPEKSGVTFKNGINENVNRNIINYIYYYNGGGVSVGDINNDNLPDLLFVANEGENKLYLNKGNLTFEDITKTSGLKSNSSWNTGATMVDINNDGYLDIYLCSVSGLLDFKGNNELFINNGDGTFTEKSKEYGLDFKGYSTQSYFFDYDKDGDLDVYIVNHAIHTTLSHGKASAREKRAPLIGDVLLRNDNNKFVDVSEKANIFGGLNGYGLSASIADFNNDGWDDIYVCNDFHEDDYYYINNQDGTFTEKHKDAFSIMSRFSMGSDAADVNADGFQDLITLDMLPNNERALKESEGDDTMFNVINKLRKLGYKDQYSRNMLQINNDGEYFYENALQNGVADTDWSWAPLIADYNNDGHQDLFITNGILRRPNDLDFRRYVASTFKFRNPTQSREEWLYQSINEMPSGKIPNQIFAGNSKEFKEETINWLGNTPTLSNGAVYSDLDLDGDLDLIVNNFNNIASIYENKTKNKSAISIKLSYKDKNKKGIGTKVILHNNNKSQLKQLFNSRGFSSSVENKLHFGLDTVSKIDSIEVIWPNNKIQTLRKISNKKEITIPYNEKKSKGFTYQKNLNKKTFRKSNIINYTHKEDFYNDYNFERLIPYKVSSSGPAYAVADIDKNGYEDVFLGNASGEKASLYLNNGKSFIKIDIPYIEKDSIFEDVSAAFIDIDNDNDLDLYVGSGISSFKNDKFQTDRLYINNEGNFVTSSKNIPTNILNTSIVTCYDYDQDGDTDIFVGNRSNPKTFGQSVNSYILNNNGKGIFSIDKNFNLSSMVTNAVWDDIDNDGVKDLIVTTEWDNPKIYMNKNGSLELMNNLPKNLNGLWQTVILFDIDNDGDKDILLGNFGLNTKFKKPTKEKPLEMYYSDFDNNGKTETVLAYHKNGKMYPLNSKDELSSQMNIISKRFINYKDFATKNIEAVLGKEAISKAKKYSINNLASGYLENNNGSFNKFKEFPYSFQLAPINSFSLINENILATGNTQTVNTYHGEYNSLKGLFLTSNKEHSRISDYGINPISSQVKQTFTIPMKNENVLFILSNNSQIKSYNYKK